MNRVSVDLGARSYDIVVGAGAIEELSTVLAGRRRAVIVTQAAVQEHAARVATVLDAAGIESTTLTIGDGEEHKSLATVGALASECAQWGLLRGDAVVAVGGGIVGDVAGFLAATYHRGIAVVQVPTTLLAMVDASIGGKTGVNLPEGKNLVGAFHQPLAVLADPTTLATLPNREFRSGLGEVAKYALIGDDVLLALLDERVVSPRTWKQQELVQEHPPASTRLANDPELLADVVARCAADKARVVEADEYEQSGARAVLNYGHTLAHALEVGSGWLLTHGEAVSIGMVFANLAAVLERVPPENVRDTEALVRGLGLGVGIGGFPLPTDEVVALMRRDKKATGGLTFMLQGPHGIERVDDPDPTAVLKALAQVGITDVTERLA